MAALSEPAEVDRGRGPARLGRVLGICFAVCVVTGMLSHYQYHPWSSLSEPAHNRCPPIA